MADKCPKCGETLITRTIQKKIGQGSIDIPVSEICPKCNWSRDLTGAGDIEAKPLAPEAGSKLEKRAEVERKSTEKLKQVQEKTTPSPPKHVLEKSKPRPSASKQTVPDMNKVITFALAFIVIVGIVLAFMPKGDVTPGSIQPTPTPGPTAGVTTPAKLTTTTTIPDVTPTGVKSIVRIDRYKYINPGQKDLKIKPGDEVVWINDDSYSLTLVSKEGLFEDKVLDNGKQTPPCLFKKAGTYTFDIQVNGVKKFSGTVTVEP